MAWIDVKNTVKYVDFHFIDRSATTHLGARRIDYLVGPIQVNTDDMEDVWVANSEGQDIQCQTVII